MRRICWPNPDATCLEGGCIHCQDAELRSETDIREYARSAGLVSNRCGGTWQEAWTAYLYGVEHPR